MPYISIELNHKAKHLLSHMLLKYMVSGMTPEIQLRSWLKNNMLRGITDAFKMFKQLLPNPKWILFSQANIFANI